MVAREGLVAEASAAWSAALAALGFVKRSGDISTRPVAKDVLGWLGLNRAVNRADALLEVNPVIGVRHQELERIVAELLGQKFHRYNPPTISIHLGYLMPEGRYRPWLFGDEKPVSDAASEMVQAIDAYGGGFMNKNASLETIVAAMEDSQVGIAEQLAFRRPVGYLLLGDLGRARDAVQVSLERLGDRRDPAAQRFRSFAAAFEEQLARSA